MLLQKTFHVRDDLARTESRLHDLRSYRRALEIVDVSSLVGGGSVRFAFVCGNGFHANLELEALTSEAPHQTLFRSVGGNIDVAGMFEFIPIRADLTEVQLTVEYTIKSPIHSVLDAVTGSLDRFLNRQLRRLQANLASEPHEPSAGRTVHADLWRPLLAH